MVYPERRFEGNPHSVHEWLAWLADWARDALRTPDPALMDAGAAGEVLVARVRLAATLLILAIPLVNLVMQLVDPPVARETLLGVVGATVGVVVAVVTYRVARRVLYRPVVGFVTSSIDVTLVSLALVSFLFIGQPHTVVNSKVVFEVYFLALAATILRFDPRVAVLATALAVVEYLGLVLFTSTRWDLNAATYAPYPYGMFSWEAQVGRLVLLATAGVIVTGITLRARRLQWLSARDRLTGLLNRSVFEDLVQHAEHRARRSGQPFAIVLLGIDRFRAFNERHGFVMGDRALRVVAAEVRRLVRQGELVARHGDDVIAVLLPETSLATAQERAATIHGAVHGTDGVATARDPFAGLTVSAGVAAFPADGADVRAVFDRAATRLVEAKQAGGGRLVGTPAPPGLQVVLVDVLDREVGRAGKLEAHQQGALHRAFSIFVRDSGGRLLLQQRAAGKYHSAGLWSNTCCGHPGPGEDVVTAARRRLREEMGIDCHMERVGTFTYTARVGDGLVEHEVDHVLLGSFDGTPIPDPAEVAEWRWLDPEELAAEYHAHPERFTAWFGGALAQLQARD